MQTKQNKTIKMETGGKQREDSGRGEFCCLRECSIQQEEESTAGGCSWGASGRVRGEGSGFRIMIRLMKVLYGAVCFGYVER